MKYKPPHLVAIFCLAYFYQAGGGGGWGPWPLIPLCSGFLATSPLGF